MATQIPLLRAKPVFGWFPVLLYVLIAGTCAFFICAGYYVNQGSKVLSWTNFIVRSFLATAILGVQVTTLRSIRDLIEAVNDL